MGEPAAEQELAICCLPSVFLIFPHYPELSLDPASHAASVESGLPTGSLEDPRALTSVPKWI